jgi:hypothetical protein
MGGKLGGLDIMRYFKQFNSSGILSRLDRAESNVSSGIEIHKVEFDMTMLGVQIFVGGANADKLAQKYKEENGIG